LSTRKKKVKGKSIVSRLTGISTPVGGISWIPPVDERDKAKRLLTFLEDRRALYHPYNMEVGDYVVKSILEIRERLTSDLEDVNKSSVLGESLTAMRATCRKFLDKVQRPPRKRYWLEPEFIDALGELRALFGIHVARLACAYDLELEKDLTSILPPEPEQYETKRRRTKER
jgi:hypothetical protein